MQVFVSYGATDRELAEKLKASLLRHGITAWSDNPSQMSSLGWQERIEQAMRQLDPPGYERGWSDRIERAVHESDAIILLLTPQTKPDEKQSRTWQVALEAVWSDDSKRMIPFLFGDVEPPAFTRSTVPRNAQLPVIRVRHPLLDWEQAIKDLVALLRHEAQPGQVEMVPAWTKKDQESHEQWQTQFSAYIDSQLANLKLPQNSADQCAREARP